MTITLAHARQEVSTFALPLRNRDRLRQERGKITFSWLEGSLFGAGPTVTDPRQGVIGDCYYICAIASIAQVRPELIRQMIHENGDGTYTMFFYRRLEDQKCNRESVIVDALIPVHAQDRLPVYARSSQKLLWPLIAEKAYAQWKGGYHAIGEGGLVERVMEELTGEATRLLFTSEHPPEILWSLLLGAQLHGWPTTLCTYGRTARSGIDTLGFHPNHIHVFLGAHTLRGKRIVQLRDAFDKPMCGKLNLPDRNGVFCLSWENFLRYFAEIAVNGRGAFEIASQPYPSISIGKALERSYVFKSVGKETRHELAKDFERVRVAPQRTLIEQGSRPDAYYLIRSGSAAIEKIHRITGRKRRIAVLRAGDQFGEMALILNTKRLSDITSLTPMLLYKLPAKKFLTWITRYSELREKFNQRFQLQLWSQKARSLLTSVSLDEMLGAGEERIIPKKKIIFQEGDIADSLYLILTGEVEVFHQNRSVKRLGEGEIFGEIGALTKVPRSASVRALVRTRLLKINLTMMANIAERFEVLQRQLEFVAERRLRILKGRCHD